MSGRSRRALLLAVVAITAVCLGAVGLRQAAGDNAPATSAAARPESQAPTKRSAVTTATELLSSLDLEVLLNGRRRRRVIDHFAARASLERLRKLYAAEKRRVAASYQRPPRFARAALAGYRVDEFKPPDSTVSVWAATIGGSGSYQPSAGWSTTTVTLTWEQGRWRVAGVRDEPGPAPDWPIETLSEEARGFEDYHHAP